MKIRNYDEFLRQDFSLGIMHDAFKRSLLTAFTETNEERWIVYNQFVTDLHDLEYVDEYQELNQRLEKGEDANKIILSIIHKSPLLKSTMGCYKNIINHFIEEDLMNYFK